MERFGIKENINDRFIFKNKKILLTGHTGFKGTWLTMILNQLGACVCGYSLPLEEKSFYTYINPKLACHIEGEISDRRLLEHTIVEFEPEIVIHLASHSSLNRNLEISDYIFQTNTMGLVNLFESIKKVKSVKSVLIVTSDKCYENLNKESGYTEENLLWAHEPYSASKVCQELITECYRSSFFSYNINNVSIATARASNVIGGGDFNNTRLIPYLLECFSNGETAKLRNPNSIRPWQSVLDVLYGYLLLVEKLYMYKETDMYCTAFNFGPAEDGFADVKTIAKALSEYFPDSKYKFLCSEENHNSETKILKLDSTKARNMLNWKTRHSLAKTLQMTADFTKYQKENKSLKKICEKYIAEYFYEE